MKPGERVKELRAKNEKNQKEFAEILGYSDAYVSEIETGKKEISVDFTNAIEERFGVSRGYILYGLSEDRWNAIKQYLQSEGLPSESIERLFPPLYSQDKDSLAFHIEEGSKTYAPILREKRLPENVSKRDFIKKVIKIYESENNTVTKALMANVEAFLYALRLEDVVTLQKDEDKEGGGHEG
jgi:transcriptional regulator with XRE-family HTH domain